MDGGEDPEYLVGRLLLLLHGDDDDVDVAQPRRLPGPPEFSF